jgi:threonylcarbamoyladenosine tRNA methylthiotransferase MtaB
LKGKDKGWIQLFFIFMKNIKFHTLGCKLNYTESSTIKEQFLNNNFIIDNDKNPDVFIINTCSVTSNAERECRQVTRRIIKENPEAFIIILGCYAQMRAEEIAKIPGVDLILGAKEKFHVLEYENKFIKYDKARIYVTENAENDEIFSADSTYSGRTRAFLKIQDGCDFRCSYCTVPLARGSSRSIELKSVVEKIKYIASEGFKEVVLTGVNVSDYGKNVNSSFLELIKAVDKVIEMPRIRISSIEPNVLTDEVIDFFAESKRLCHHFHIPLQSGDDTILNSMQRRYNTARFRNTVNKIIQKIPSAGIGLDVIVGFPNETEELFENTYSFLQDIPFSYLHVFTYSPRPGTKASAMKKVFTDCTLRSEKLRELSIKRREEFYKKELNNIYGVLVEERSKDNIAFGLTHNYIKAGFPKEYSVPNEIINIKLLELRKGFVYGELSENNSLK